MPPQPVSTAGDVIWAYDTRWEYSDVKWASRWDLYLYMGDDQVHWFSLLNSLVIVLLLVVSGQRAMRRNPDGVGYLLLNGGFLLTFLCYPGITQTCFRFFQTQTFDKGYGSYLIADYRIDTDSAAYRAMTPFAIAMVAVWQLLLPSSPPPLWQFTLWATLAYIGIEFIEVPHSAAVDALKRAGNSVFLTVKRKKRDIGAEKRTAKIWMSAVKHTFMHLSAPRITSKALVGDPMVIHLTSFPQ